MKLLRVICLLSLTCLLSGQAALAAAGTSSPSFTWTGPYVGLHVGYGWGSGDTNFNPLPDPVSFGMPATKLTPHPSGVQGGIQAGYNYQMGCFVAGIEADFSGAGMSGARFSPAAILGDGTQFPALTAHQEINWFGTLRPRLGYTVTPNVLVYGTAGLAYGNVSSSANTDFRPIFPTFAYYPASVSQTNVGWTAGGGIEYAISKCWSVKAEYLYMDLGSQSAVANPNLSIPFQVGYKWQTTANILNFGVNYRF